MQHFPAFGLSCLERDRLADELGEAQTRGRNLARLRKLTLAERVSLEQRENLAQARLRNHVGSTVANREFGSRKKSGAFL